MDRMTHPFFRLDGAVALITGAGTGIGKATALALAGQGAQVAITELPGMSHRAEAVVNAIREMGREAMALALDVRALLTVESVVGAVADRFGRFDILVNNAGTQVIKPALDLEESEFDEVLNVNLKGAFFCAQAAARIMAVQGGGCIINVASQHGVVGNVNRAPYAASKGGLLALTRALAVEWAPYNIRVNAVSPTFVRTETNVGIFDVPEVADEIKRGVLIGRPAVPDEVAAGILYLSSPAAAMVTGHNLLIDGGWTAR